RGEGGIRSRPGLLRDEYFGNILPYPREHLPLAPTIPTRSQGHAMLLHQMHSRLTLISISAIVLLLLAPGCKKEEAAPVVQPVKVTKVIQKTVPIYFEAIGQTRGAVEVDVRARVNGIIESIDFQEGKPVKKGQLLCTIDPQQYQATLATAKGKYAQAKADYEKAKADVTRYKPLVEKNAISREEYETAVSKEPAASAQVEAAKGSMKTAELDVSYCRVTAPEGGLIG